MLNAQLPGSLLGTWLVWLLRALLHVKNQYGPGPSQATEAQPVWGVKLGSFYLLSLGVEYIACKHCGQHDF